MKEYKILSEYYADDSVKKAQVVKEVGSTTYLTRMMSDTGSYFVASFKKLEDAECAADDWVRS